jgi:hypothetical protein
MLTQEQIELMLRLEGVFMPYARRQRDEAYQNLSAGDNLRFVHYTSAEAALSIIRSKRMWMRNATCMSDYREIQHGFEMLGKIFFEKSSKAAFVGTLDSCTPSVATEAIEKFEQWSRDIRFSTYLACISEHDSNEDMNGRLSMWRAFGGSTVRVGMVFSLPRISNGSLALRLIFSPVAYLTEKQIRESFAEVVRNIGAGRSFLQSVNREVLVQTVFYMLVAAATCLKHEGFREEREWRAIYTPTLLPSPLMERSTEVICGVPQVVYKLPLDTGASPELADLDFGQIFDRLIVGPCPYPWVVYEAFRDALAATGVQGAAERVHISGIPVRI